MRVLIFGSKGSLGQQLMKIFADSKPVGLDKDKVDITEPKAVDQALKKFRPELVINCAGFTEVDRAEKERMLADQINGKAPGFIAAACSEIDAILVQISTGQVFPGDNPSGYNEDDATKPVNAYGMSKLLGEMEVARQLEKYYIIRTCWLYGQDGSGKKSFVSKMLELGKSGEAKVVNGEFGSPTYTQDLAHAMMALVSEKKPFGIYHLTNAGSASRYDWAKEIFMLKNLEVDLQPVSGSEFTREAIRPKYEILNNTKFIELRPWTEALKEFLE